MHSSSSHTAVTSAAAGPLKLTLSAYCRPEHAVRLTDAPPARVIDGRYELLDPSRRTTLGHGASATVRLAYRRRDDRPVAVKTIAKHEALGLWNTTHRWQAGVRSALASPRDAAGEIGQQVRRAPRLDEADVLSSLGDCRDIVQLLDVYETHEEVQLVLEYCEGGDLFDCIGRRKLLEQETTGPEAEPPVRGSFAEAETATAAKTLLGVLDALHARHIVHRDIKPSNILLVGADDARKPLGAVKLADFGLARVLHADSSLEASGDDDDDLSMKRRRRAYSRVGSDYYAAPEVHLCAGYDTPIDVYSLGVTLFVMLCGAPPSSTSLFKSEDADLTYEGSSHCAVSDESVSSSQCSRCELFPPELNISSSAQDLISKMMHPDPDKRITASEALQHDWIQHSVHEDARRVTHVASKHSLPSNIPRIMSAETESLLRIGTPVSVVPPSNSPDLEISRVGNDGWTPRASNTPAAPPVHCHTSTNLSLADVCNKLAPLVKDRRLHKRRRSPTHGVDLVFTLPRKHARSVCGGDSQSRQKVTKEACLDSRLVLHPQLTPDSFAIHRIGWRFNSHIPVMEPSLLQQSKSSAVHYGCECVDCV